MSNTRRGLLGALASGAVAGLAGCGRVDGADDIRAAAAAPAPPDGSPPGRIGDAIYAPGSSVEADHRVFAVRDFESLRPHRDANPVAAGLLERPEGKAAKGFDLDPSTVEAYARYTPTELFAGSFEREGVLASFRDDGWTVSETCAGFDVVVHPEHPEFYAGAVGDGLFLTAARHREVPPAAFVRAHAGAVAGETERYRDDPDLAELFSVVGGGDYVTGITVPPEEVTVAPGFESGSDHALAIGRSLAVSGGSVVETVGVVFEESAPRSPEAYLEEWTDGSADPGVRSETRAEGRVGYVSRTFSPEDYDREGLEASVRNDDPAVSVQRRLNRRHAEEHGLEPPEAAFLVRAAPDDADPSCGDGEYVVEFVHESGEAVPARRLTAVNRLPGGSGGRPIEVFPFHRCGSEVDETLTEGDATSFGFGVPPRELVVQWRGPHGARADLPTEPE